MRLPRASRTTVYCALIAVLAGAACGGGSSGEKAPDQSKIATATLPAVLPEPTIIGGGGVQDGGASTYKIRQGDTLASIATRFGVSLEDLRAANPNVDASRLSVGQTIRLPSGAGNARASAPSPTEAPLPDTPTPAGNQPEASAATPTAAAPTSTPASLGQIYVVQAGDIPVNIAAKFGITVEALLAANPGINPTDLHIGQVLVIPPKPSGG